MHKGCQMKNKKRQKKKKKKARRKFTFNFEKFTINFAKIKLSAKVALITKNIKVKSVKNCEENFRKNFSEVYN